MELVSDVVQVIWSFQTELSVILNSRIISRVWRDTFPLYFKKVKGENQLIGRIRFLLGSDECSALNVRDYWRVCEKGLFELILRMVRSKIEDMYVAYLPMIPNGALMMRLAQEKIEVRYRELKQICREMRDLEVALALIPVTNPADCLSAAAICSADPNFYIPFMTEVVKRDLHLKDHEKNGHIRKIIKYQYRIDRERPDAPEGALDWALGHLMTPEQVEEFIWPQNYWYNFYDSDDEEHFHRYPREAYGVLFRYLPKTAQTFFRVSKFPQFRVKHEDQVKTLLSIVPELSQDEVQECYVQTANRDFIEVTMAIQTRFPGLNMTDLFYRACKHESLQILDMILARIIPNPDLVLYGIYYSCQHVWGGKGIARLIQELPRLKIVWKQAAALVPKLNGILPIQTREDFITDVLILLGEYSGDALFEVTAQIEMNWQRLFRRLCRRGGPIRLLNWLLDAYPKGLGELQVGIQIAREKGHEELARDFGRRCIFWM